MEEKNNYEKLMENGYQKYQYGEYNNALENFKQATKITKKNNLIEQECEAIKMEATALYRLARYQEAEGKYYVALDLAVKKGFKTQECRIYNHLIALHEMRNKYDKAKECIDRGYNLALELKDELSLAKILNSKGVYYHIFGNDDDALKCYEDAMTLYKKIENKRGIGTTYNLIAGYHYLLEDYDNSLEYYQKANTIGKELPDFDMIALSACRMGLIHYKKNDKESALEILKDPIFLAEKIENKKIIVEVFFTKGLIYKSIGQRETAIKNFEMANQLADNLGSKYLTARINKEIGIFYLEEGDIRTSFDYLKKCIEIFEVIREKIKEDCLKKQFKDSFQDILELIWSLSNIIDNLKKDYEKREMQYINKAVISLCKLSNEHSQDYALKLQTKLLTNSTIKKLKQIEREKTELEKEKVDLVKDRENLKIQNENLKKEIKFLKSQIEVFKKQYQKIKKDPTKYEELAQEDLKNFINTKIWKDNENQLLNNYLKEYFSKLNERSKEELTLLKTILDIMDSGYEICAFLLTKVVERELRLKIFKEFKYYWKNILKKKNYIPVYNNINYLKKNEKFKENLEKTNQRFFNYLNKDLLLVLGSIYYILREINHYCKKGNSKIILFGWENEFIDLFGINFCKSIDNILYSFQKEIQSKKDSIKLIELRNLVSHPHEVEVDRNGFKEIEFDKDFIEKILKFLTIEDPPLLKIICEIKPIF